MTAAARASSASLRRKPLWKRRLMIVSRWLHIYLSMACFGIVFFFAVTGLTLNHGEWFAAQQKTIQVRGTMDRRLVEPKVLKAEVIDYLHHSQKLQGAVN